MYGTKKSRQEINTDLKNSQKIYNKIIMERIAEASDESMPTSTDYEPEHVHHIPISNVGKRHGPSMTNAKQLLSVGKISSEESADKKRFMQK